MSARVLVAEDNVLTRSAIVEILKSRGFEVEATANGQQALQALSNSPPPDIIILDMLLPVLDGWHFLDALNRLNLQPRPWVIIASGSQVIGREWAADHGCGGFLRKPIEAEELLDEIQRC